MTTNDEFNAQTPTEGAPAKPKRETLTYSSLQRFRNCRRAFKYRFEDNLQSITQSDALWTGSAFHDALHVQHLERKNGASREAALATSLAWLDQQKMVGYASDPDLRGKRDLIRAMLRNYEWRWGTPRPYDDISDSTFEEVLVEYPFVLPLRNPESGRNSIRFQIAGKIDGLVRYKPTGQLFILEHKTASSIGPDYLGKLWADFQSQMYAALMTRVVGEQVVGVIYDITAKSQISRKGGETEEEFQERLSGYKTEKTRVKHLALGPKQAETDEEFEARLDEWYQNPESDRFVRQIIYFDTEALENVEGEIWELTQQILDARRRKKWGQNTTQCFAFGACAYTAICQNHGKIDDLNRSLYIEVPAHEELREVLPAGYSAGGVSLQDSLATLEAEFDRAFGAEGQAPIAQTSEAGNGNDAEFAV